MRVHTLLLTAFLATTISAAAIPQEVGAPADVIPANPEGDIAAQQVDPAAAPPADPAAAPPADPAPVDPAAAPPADPAAAPPADPAAAPPAEPAPADAAPAAGGDNVFTGPSGEVNGKEPVTITWTPGNPDSMITITLLRGAAPDSMQEISKVAVAVPNSGSFTWVPAADLPASTDADKYAFSIFDESTQQTSWSGQFALRMDAASEPADAAASSSAAAAPTPTSSSSDASSSAPAPTSSSTPPTSSAPATTTASSTSTSAAPTAAADDSDDEEDDKDEKEDDDDDADFGKTSDGPNIGAIVGGVLGGLVGVALLLVLGAFLARRLRKQKTKRNMRTSGFVGALQAVEKEHELYMRQRARESAAARGEDVRSLRSSAGTGLGNVF